MLHPTRQALGFTIVEIVVAISLIAILATISVVSWSAISDRAHNTDRLNEVKSWENIITLYASQERKYPPVPSFGSYCLGTGFPDMSSIDSRFDANGTPTSGRWSAAELALPSTTGFCGKTLSYGVSEWPSRHHVNDTINTELSTVGDIPKNTQQAHESVSLIGPFITYSPSRIFLTQSFIGRSGNCPDGTTLNAAGSEGGMVLCDIDLPIKPFDITP